MVRAFPTPRQRVRGGGWLKSVKKSASYARTQARLPVLLNRISVRTVRLRCG
jgi:hypothetical protein